jgi:hypothetical protein
VANSSASTGVSWAGPTFTAGKNKIINGDFGVWQRGTSFSLGNGTTYTADRWRTYRDGSGATVNVTQQAFTPGTAPVAGYESQYYLQFAQTVAGSGGTYSALTQPIENVQTFAGQTVTLSFWAKASSSLLVTPAINQVFGSGGSSTVYNYGTNQNLTTSWARYSWTVTLALLAGKTIGTGSYVDLQFELPVNSVQTISIWGVQLEAGSVATPFTTATGTLQGELMACQRYYYKNSTAVGASNGILVPSGTAVSGTVFNFFPTFPVPMRTAPTTGFTFNGFIGAIWASSYNGGGTSSLVASNVTPYGALLTWVGSASSGPGANYAAQLFSVNDSTAYIAFSAEL